MNQNCQQVTPTILYVQSKFYDPSGFRNAGNCSGFFREQKSHRRSVRIGQSRVTRIAVAVRTNRVGQNDDMRDAVRAVLNSGGEFRCLGSRPFMRNHAATGQWQRGQGRM